jgi:hypothetical protein
MAPYRSPLVADSGTRIVAVSGMRLRGGATSSERLTDTHERSSSDASDSPSTGTKLLSRISAAPG